MLLLALLVSVTPVPARLKVLCLHGYGQTGAVLRDRSGGFRKPLKKSRFEMTYPDGPYGCTAAGEDEAEAEADAARRAWWRGNSGQYDGWSETRASLKALCEREQYDGILGFSQGAAAAAMLCAELRPRFGIFVSGFVPRDEVAAAELYAGVGDDVATLHVYGESDELVVAERSRALVDLFADATVAEHPGGHMIPSGPLVRESVVEFLERLEL